MRQKTILLELVAPLVSRRRNSELKLEYQVEVDLLLTGALHLRRN